MILLCMIYLFIKHQRLHSWYHTSTIVVIVNSLNYELGSLLALRALPLFSFFFRLRALHSYNPSISLFTPKSKLIIHFIPLHLSVSPREREKKTYSNWVNRINAKAPKESVLEVGKPDYGVGRMWSNLKVQSFRNGVLRDVIESGQMGQRMRNASVKKGKNANACGNLGERNF